MEKLTLKQIRLLKGLTQKELADLLEMPMYAIQRRETGHTKWTIDEVAKLVEKLEIDTGMLNLKP